MTFLVGRSLYNGHGAQVSLQDRRVYRLSFLSNVTICYFLEVTTTREREGNAKAGEKTQKQANVSKLQRSFLEMQFYKMT